MCLPGDDAGWEISSPTRFSSEKFQPLIVVDGHRADRKVCVGGRALSRVWCGDRFRSTAAKQGFRVSYLFSRETFLEFPSEHVTSLPLRETRTLHGKVTESEPVLEWLGYKSIHL